MAALREVHFNLRVLVGQIRRCSLIGTNVTTQHANLKSARCYSQAAPQPEEPEPAAKDDVVVNPTFINRNPLNLGLMALGVKDRGWATTWPHQEYYHRLVFSRTQHHVIAEVFAYGNPQPVLTCSTREWAVKRELPSTRSVAACQAVGEILAQRCHQAGITRMVYRAIPWQYRSDAIQSFRRAVKEGGVLLSEPRRKYIGT